MEYLSSILEYALPFLIVLTPIVFVHELGHFWVARRNGVRVETFSIGFGPELFGWTGRSGTRWKISAIPLGGYVKMYGDDGVASTPGEAVRHMSDEERAVSFHHKRLGQRIAVVAAGPIANFLFAAVIFWGLFAIYGQPFTPPDVGAIVPGSAAERAGMEVGDRVVQISGKTIERFEDIQRIVQLNLDRPIEIVVLREGREVRLNGTPMVVVETDPSGGSVRIARLGIRGSGMEFVRHPPHQALWRGIEETYNHTAGTLRALSQMILGQRTADDLGGPIRIAQMSGEVARGGLAGLLMLMAVLSVNLGLINLFPIPLLDGGHLLFYAAEGLLGRPLAARTQDYGFRIGMVLIFSLMIFSVWNDLVQLRVVAYVVGLVS